MTNMLNYGLTAVGQSAPINTLGQSFVGFNIGGTWVGTILFQVSYDSATWTTLDVQVYPGGTANAPVSTVASTSTTNLNGFYFANLNSLPTAGSGGSPTAAVACRALLSSYTSGTPIVTVATSIDNSYINCSLAKNVLQQTQTSVTTAAQTITQAASTTHSWQLASLIVGASGTTIAGMTVTVKDGTNTIFVQDLPVLTGGGPSNPAVALPPNGLFGSVNSAMSIIVSAPTTGISSVLSVTFNAA
jgi:hypothetical protein